MSIRRILLFNGGESEEHEITLTSVAYLKKTLQKIVKKLKAPPFFEILDVMISKKGGEWSCQGLPCALDFQKNLRIQGKKPLSIHGAIPFLHGYPCETGHLLALLELYHIPYLGPPAEAAVLSFNKASTKYWMNTISLPVSPGIVLINSQKNSLQKGLAFLEKYGDIFIKASNQGSSRGCYRIKDKKDFEKILQNTLKLSPYAVLEKRIKGRELEVAVYEYQDQLQATPPGEILPPEDSFYSYEEKYHEKTQTQTLTIAPNLPEEILQKIHFYSLEVFKVLKLRDFARIDFFYSPDDGLLLNEVNTYPGLTSISMFPKMIEKNGLLFQDFIWERLQKFAD